jgi:type II secretory pathway pseudopilin PulG
MHSDSRPSSRVFRAQSGMTVLETMIAIAVLLIATVGIMSIALVATSTTENQGHLASRTAEYAQDKLEQLIALAYGDGDAGSLTGSDTTVFPAANSGGTGLAVGGSSNPASPIAGYVDYLDLSGNPLAYTGGAPPAGWYYIRVWQISLPSGTTNLKQITVTARVRTSVGGTGNGSGVGALPQSTVTTLKTAPF